MNGIDVDFTEAISNGEMEIVVNMVETGLVDVNVPDRDGDLPLLVAAKKNQIAIVEYLLQMGALVDSVDENGWTALQEAALCGAEDIVRTLLKWGADKSIRNREGQHALDIAVQFGHGPVVFVLCEGHDPTIGFF
ncbi:unnamed protein product [Aphanomyces euteiches]|uniref:Uncharacterized protein n=1 Tax=Aphanomyces euteiches TaxID=100861 RepID=A0A6G0WPT8_9STRA|nr:hypothetical protein Ae201684_012918 [Aphanomyces euteiches]KAH9153413.1 hypothetical protein AeRB84_004343 [Aphanomyces euteiches]